MSNQNVEMIGMGVESPVPIQAPAERVWEIMVDKVYNTAKYLPVTDVKTKDITPRHVHRVMSTKAKTIEENIYLDKANYEIRFAAVGEDQVHINRYYPETGILKYWRENNKGERVPWEFPKAGALQAIIKTKEFAEASQ